MKVYRVVRDFRRNTVVVYAEGELYGSLKRLEVEVDPRPLHGLVTSALGRPPYRAGALEVETALLGSMLGVPWTDPRKTYRRNAAPIVVAHLKRSLCCSLGINTPVEVPEEAALACLDGLDWEA